MTRLTPQLLVSAYVQGVFPMSVGGEIRWFSPDPRAILPLDSFHASKTLMATYRQARFEVRLNTAFLEVMRQCSDRKDGSWISPAIIRAYGKLHDRSLAHSVEAWQDGKLAGGLYGVAIGGAFFGESMFHSIRDASKVALVALVHHLNERGYALLDVQYQTDHLKRFGCIEISREEYLRRLTDALRTECVFA